jgi:hypothetical protein
MAVVLRRGSGVRSLAVLADERLASGGRGSTIKLWPKGATGEPVVLSQLSTVLSLAVLADGRLASGDLGGRLKLWPKDGVGEPVFLSQGSPVESLATDRRQRRSNHPAIRRLMPSNKFDHGRTLNYDGGNRR